MLTTYPTIKFNAGVSQIETTSSDTTVHKGQGFKKERILDVRTHFKPTETFQYTHFKSCHPAGVKKGFVKGEVLRLQLTLQSSHLKRTLKISKHVLSREVTRSKW